MKRSVVHALLFTVVAGAIFGGMLVYIGGPDGPQPVFRPFEPRDLVGFDPRIAYQDLHFSESLDDGKVWIGVADRKAKRGWYLLFDIKTGVIEGALENANPVAYSAELQSVICTTREVKGKSTLPDQAWWFFENIGILGSPYDEREDHYKVSLGEEARHLGAAYQGHGTGSFGQLSPDGRHYRVQTTSNDHLLFDLESQSVDRLEPARDWGGGWWSDEQCLYTNQAHDLELYNVREETREVAIPLKQIDEFLAGNGLASRHPDHYGLRRANAPDGDQFFLTGSIYEKDTWLIKIDKDKRDLVLVSRHFPFRSFGWFNADGSLYVGYGESDTGDRNAVYLHDVASSQTTTLVAPDKAKDYCSYARFYGDTIIYVRDGSLHSMELDGSNQRVLFDPATYGKAKP